MRLNSADPLIRPITDRAARDRQTNLQCWHYQHEADANHQDGGGSPEYITIEPDREADRGDKQTNSDEGQRNSAREDQGAAAMLTSRRAKDNREQGQNAGRQNG